MAASLVYRCACGAERKLTNHWFVAQVREYGGLYLYTWDRATEMGILEDRDSHHLCGHNCAAKLQEEFMRGTKG